MVRGTILPKVYAVARGRKVGIVDNWEACKAATWGVSGCLFRSFSTQAEARAWLSVAAGDGESAGAATAPADAAAAPAPGLLRLGPRGPAEAAAAPAPGLLRLGPRGFVARFDGACLGNPGPGGAGALLYGLPPPHSSGARDYNVGHGVGVAQGWEVLWSGAEHVGGDTTNNVAEYTGLLLALKAALRLGMGHGALLVQGDSELIIRQVLGEYQVRAPHLLVLHAEVMRTLAQLRLRKVDVRFRHILRDKNAEADALSNAGVVPELNAGGGGGGGGAARERWAPVEAGYTAPQAKLKRFGLGGGDSREEDDPAAEAAPVAAGGGGGGAAASSAAGVAAASVACAVAAATAALAPAGAKAGSKRPREDEEEVVVLADSEETEPE
jgi:ribonuclease HI